MLPPGCNLAREEQTVSHNLMQEYEIKMAQLAGEYRAGRATGEALRRFLRRAWRWRRRAFHRNARRELIGERAC